MKALLRWLLLAAWWATIGAVPAHAHKPSDAYLRLTPADGGRIDGQWDIALRDLEFAIGLDADGDGAITWGELRRRHEAIAAYALARLRVSAAGQSCPATTGEQLVDQHTDGAYTVLKFELRCPAAAREIEIAYTLFGDIDPQHRGLLNLATSGGTRTAVLEPRGAPARFAFEQPAAQGRWGQAWTFAREGVWHIWIGLDHILFLLALLLPAVLVWQPPSWQPAGTLRGALLEVVKIVTAFTAAHSVTLSLATLGVVELPSRFVESTIAASVVLAALNNLRPVVRGKRWTVAFGFGLVHGFGFASVLADLGLPPDALVLALVAFNVGVEVGQLAIVAIFLPAAFALRRTSFYRSVVFRAGSVAIAVLATLWFIERAFDVRLLGL